MDFEKMIDSLYHQRKDDSIKNDFGKMLIIGGSRKYPNAVLISALLAGVSGVGFVSIGVPDSIYPEVVTKSGHTVTFEPSSVASDDISYSERQLEQIMKNYSSILFGNGISDSLMNKRLLGKLLLDYEGILVIDATGISLLSQLEVTKFKPKVILTPHLGEAGNLLKMDTRSRNPEDYVKEAKLFCKKNQCQVLLKSDHSVLVDEEGNDYPSDYPPTPCLAKAGSGDGLSGYLAGILAYGTKDFSLVDCILFADKMIHEAALQSQEKLSKGIADILTSKEEIAKIIVKYKRSC